VNPDLLWWALSVALILGGVAGTILPALPGPAFVLAGVVLAAWIEDFTRVGGLTVAVVSVLAVIGWVLDYVAGLLGARKAGASPQALAGAAIGTLAGLLGGVVGVLFLPLVGAAVGEYLARRGSARSGPSPQEAVQTSAGGVGDAPGGSPALGGALKVGLATWLGIMVGLIAKVVVVFMMVGVFVVALIW
jgi:uncharacterized protein YqgC (DUF456 family)